jgi:hypothetical protein
MLLPSSGLKNKPCKAQATSTASITNKTPFSYMPVKENRKNKQEK